MQHLRIGITGGMGAGKSTVCEIFSKIGISVYDADSRAKWLMSEDQDLKQQIKSNFGWDSYTRNEDLNRDYLAKVVFNNEIQSEKPNYRIQFMASIDPISTSSQEFKKIRYPVERVKIEYEGKLKEEKNKIGFLYKDKEDLEIRKLKIFDTKNK